MDLGRLLQVFSMQLYIGAGGSILILEIVFHNYSLIYIYIYTYIRIHMCIYIYTYLYKHIYSYT